MTVAEFFDAWRRKQAGYPCRFEGHKWEKIGEAHYINHNLGFGGLPYDVMKCRACGEEKEVLQPPEPGPNCRCCVNLPQIKELRGLS